MINIIKGTFTALGLFFLTTVYAQNGTIRGKVIDNATGEELIGVSVLVKGTTTGSVTDFEGVFQISVSPGTYELQVSYVSFETMTISDVLVESNKVTVFENIRLREAVSELEEIVVSAKVIKDSESALLTVKRKSPNVLDGISAQNFKKIGDGDAASAVKRVTGVSVQDGKYVFVRGLGDRYTKSILNGMDIPGLDPDRNSLQMDIFPTNVIDNLIVLKSFTSDLGADFTGGVINIETKDFPEERISKVGISAGYNPSMHFNSNYIKYDGGSTDFLGFDDGTRDIPTNGFSNIPFRTNALTNPGDAATFSQILNNFNPKLSAMRANSLMDYGVSLSLGNQKPKGRFTLGYNLALSYKNSTEFFQDTEFNRFGKGDTPDVIELQQFESQVGDYGVNNVLVAGLGGFAVKTSKSKFKLSALHLQNGESKAGIFKFVNTDQGANFDALQHNLEYSERTMTNLLLNGTHSLGAGRSWEVDWKVSPTQSKIVDPDIRFTRFRTDGGTFRVSTESGLPERIWRFLDEQNLAAKVDATKQYKIKGTPAKLGFGTGYVYKQRDYNIENFQILPGNTVFTGNPDELFFPQNLWSSQNMGGVSYDPQFIPTNPNKYDANITNTSFYVSNEFNAFKNLKMIVGVRAENYEQRYTGENQNGDKFDNVVVLDALDFFPSANLIYSLSENQNLRFSYAKTIARPSFKEASFATILDPLSGRTFIGGFFNDINVATGEEIWDGKLKATDIHNFDLRYEIFQPGAQTISVSAFYKTFNNPIEIVQYVQAANNFQPRNVGDGQVIGAEVEFRQSLGALGRIFENLSVTTNVTITESRIDMSATEFLSRQQNARDGERIKNTRDMAGQAPYIINAGLMYDGLTNGFEAGLFYNVQGKTLQYVGISNRPDVYSVPFNSLNFNANKSFGQDGKLQLGININNILGDFKEQEFKSFGAQDQYFSRLRPGTTIGVSLGYKL